MNMFPFKAHKLILVACSPVLKDLLLNNPHSHPLIYLRGVELEELRGILQFIYSGKADICRDRTVLFFKAAKELQIEKINDAFIDDTVLYDDHVDVKDIDSKIGNVGSWFPSQIKTVNDSDQMFEGKTLTNCKDKPNMKKYDCDKCESTFTDRRNRNKHRKRKHEGARYYCSQCLYKAIDLSSLKSHTESVHEGVRYPCNLCDHKAPLLSQLKRRIRIVHEGIKYSCTHCGHTATQLSNLRRHEKSVHEGMKYFCDECDFQTSRNDNLVNHKRMKHDQSSYFMSIPIIESK